MTSERVQRRIDRFLDEIEEAIAALDWRVARDRAAAVLALDPENQDALAFLAAADRALAGAPGSPTEATVSVQPPGPPSEAPPAFFKDGRYVVKEFLGEGARKKVYLVHDTLLDRDVAFALIKIEGLDETGRQRILREAQTMGRLGDHPNIVQLHDLGDERGQPYMVMPVMSGGDVQRLMERAPDRRLPLEQAIAIAENVCLGLEFAHSQGIVHRDLKPGNVWLTSDGTARIGDFGLAVSMERSRLTSEGMMMGTVSYMPPEQATGGQVDERSDLYSLGAMLYEMVTGRLPFLGDDPLAVIGQHVNTPPVAPSWHNSACPRPLEALVLRLLGKDPAERPGSAADVLTALEGVDLSASVEGRSESQARSLDSLSAGVFVGRRREMGELKAALEDALGGHGRLVMLVGEPGIGKTRTAQELATYAGLRGAQVLWGRCHEERGMPPYWPWIQAIRSYVRERDPEELRSEMGSGGADVAEIVSEVRERLPGLERPPELESPEAARFRLFDSITSFLKAASGRQTLVLMLDDLHWADKPSLLLLEFMARELGGARLLVVGNYRDVELSRQHPLAETLGELTRERLFQRVLLRGLTEEDIGRFIEVTSGISPLGGLVNAVHTQTEGNPLFVTEVVRLLVQEGELTLDRATERDSWEVRIPEGVREVIGRRLNRLSARCNETLTIGAVIGREFELRQLTRLVEDISEDRLLEVLEEALSARVIEELPDAVGRYQFTHALIQQTLMDELSTTRRVRLHARIIDVFEELYGEGMEAHAVELAYHAGEAEAMIGPDKLLHYSIMAGERGLKAYAYEDARAHFQRSLDARQDEAMDDQLATIKSGIALSSFPTMRSVDEARPAWDALSQAFDYYVEKGDIEKALNVAIHPIPGALVTGAADLSARALELVPRESIKAGYLLSRRAVSLIYEFGDFEGSLNAAMEAITIARRENDEVLEARSLASLANTLLNDHRPQEAIDPGLKAIEIAQRIGDLQSEQRAQVFLAQAFLTVGEPDRARIHADAAYQAAEKLHEREIQAVGLWISAHCAAYKGDWSKADELADQVLEIMPQHGLMLGLKAGISSQGNDVGAIKHLADNLSSDLAAASFVSAWLTRTAYETNNNEYMDMGEAALIAVERSTHAFWRFWIRHCAAVAAVLRKDTAAAAEQYSALAREKGTVGPALFSVDHILALLARTMGKLDDAATHFEDALTFCRKAGYRPELAWSLCDYADMLSEQDGPGDQEKASKLLDESLTISRELGMRPLMERVLSQSEILGA